MLKPNPRQKKVIITMRVIKQGTNLNILRNYEHTPEGGGRRRRRRLVKSEVAIGGRSEII